MNFEGILLENLASMKSSILSYRMGLAHSCDFGDEDKLRQHLLVLLNHILSKARETVASTDHTGTILQLVDLVSFVATRYLCPCLECLL